MDSKTRFSTQSKDPYAGSVLFGSGASPQTTQAISPVHSHTSSYGMSPMQAMNGASIIRTPYQSRRFSSQEATPQSVRKSGMGTQSRRPPLSSLLDDKITTFSTNNNDYALPDTPSDTTGFAASDVDSAHKFPLYSSASLRNELFSPAKAMGLSAAASKSSFSSPVPARPPLRSMLDSSVECPSNGHPSSSSGSAQPPAVRSPVLTLGPYAPSMDKLDAAWSCWIVVSGFFPSTSAREMTLQRFLQFGDVQDHALTAGNWMFIKYASPVHAERAASQHGTLLNAGTLLSVLVLNPRLAQHLDVHLRRDGSLEIADCTAGMAADGTVAGETVVSGAGLGAGLRQRNAGTRSVTERDGLLGGNSADLHPTSVSDGNSSSSLTRTDDLPDLYLQPRRRKSVCERVVEYFFSY